MRIKLRLIKGLVLVSGLVLMSYLGLWLIQFAPATSPHGGLKPTLLLALAGVCFLLGVVAEFFVRHSYPLRDYRTLMLLCLPYHVILWGAEPRFLEFGLLALSLCAATVFYITWKGASFIGS